MIDLEFQLRAMMPERVPADFAMLAIAPFIIHYGPEANRGLPIQSGHALLNLFAISFILFGSSTNR
jgi:hypothetical protein